MPRTALVVDDSRFARGAVARLFQGLSDWETIEAATGDEAVELAKQHDLDFVSMDMNMPGIDGLEAAQQIRQQFPDLPICLVTANIQDKVRERATSLGIAFAEKPLSQESLKAILEKEFDACAE